MDIDIDRYGCGPKWGFVAVPPSVTDICRGPSVTNPCRGPLFKVLQFSIGLSQGGFVARPPDAVTAVTSLVAKRPPGPVANPMFFGGC